ncbi:MAG: hypothetical protein AVDCRST_MAG13-3773, partial [uncultured Solirubrobacteraceae bacterium]
GVPPSRPGRARGGRGRRRRDRLAARAVDGGRRGRRGVRAAHGRLARGGGRPAHDVARHARGVGGRHGLAPRVPQDAPARRAGRALGLRRERRRPRGPPGPGDRLGAAGGDHHGGRRARLRPPRARAEPAR